MLQAAQALDVIASYQAAHAEANEIERSARSQVLLDVGVNLTGQNFQSCFAVVRGKIDGVNLPAALFQISLEAFEEARGIPQPVEQQQRVPRQVKL